MVLVEYSDSEDSNSPPNSKDKRLSVNDATTLLPHKRRKLEDHGGPDGIQRDGESSTAKSPPPLPSTFHSLYATNVRTSTTDDPSLHGGRKRQVAHVEGNWPSHVYLEWLPDNPHLQHLNAVISRVQNLVTATTAVHDRLAVTAEATATPRDNSSPTEPKKLHNFLSTSLGARLPLHISLSTSLVLTGTTKTTFHDSLVDAVQAAKTGPITTRLTELDLVPNFEGSRWFLVARVTDQDGGALMKLLTVCNRVCEEFGLARLYQSGLGIGVVTKGGDHAGREGSEDNRDNEDGSEVDVGVASAFHISIAWMLNGPSTGTRKAVQEIQMDGVGREAVCFDRLKIKIGNVVDDVIL